MLRVTSVTRTNVKYSYDRLNGLPFGHILTIVQKIAAKLLITRRACSNTRAAQNGVSPKAYTMHYSMNLLKFGDDIYFVIV